MSRGYEWLRVVHHSFWIWGGAGRGHHTPRLRVSRGVRRLTWLRLPPQVGRQRPWHQLTIGVSALVLVVFNWHNLETHRTPCFRVSRGVSFDVAQQVGCQQLGVGIVLKFGHWARRSRCARACCTLRAELRSLGRSSPIASSLGWCQRRIAVSGSHTVPHSLTSQATL